MPSSHGTEPVASGRRGIPFRARSARCRPLCLLLLIAMQFVAIPAARAQFEIPANIRRIMDKAQAGKEITPAEQKTLEEWGASESKRGEKAMAARSAAAAKLDAAACPRKIASTGVAATAPTRDSYLAMLKTAAPVYGAMAGKARVSIDSALRTAKRDGEGADLGAALLTTGAGSAAAYATIWSAIRRPDDALAANNLGVVLSGMGDYPRALSSLRYADALKPNSALILTDLGWAHYNMGNFVGARTFFEGAARVSAGYSPAQLGLGLVAECLGNHAAAVGYLRKALASQYSAVGAAALKAARGAAAPARSGRPEPATPIASEQGESRGLELPDPPISDLKVSTAAADQALARLDGEVDGRIKSLLARKQTQASIVARQIARSLEAPDRAVVIPRDFATELFLFEDVGTSLFGGDGPVGAGLRESESRALAVVKEAERAQPEMEKDFESQRLLLQKFEACGSNEACLKAVNYQMEQLAHKMCLGQKKMLDYQYSNQYKAWQSYWGAVKSASKDYYGLTAPILEKVYPPTLNDLLSTERELVILLSYQTALQMGASLPGIANNYQSLECIPPEPPPPPDEPQAPTVEKKTPPPCPFKSPLNLSVAIVSFTLDCESAKLEGGEGLLLSLKRDFTRHETTMGVGVGAQVGGVGVSGGAKVMVEVTTDGQNVTDVALGSSVSAQAGFVATANAELGAQVSLRGGPEIAGDTSTTLTLGGLTLVP